MKRCEYVSPTQIRMWKEQCQMLWFLNYREDRRGAPTRAQLLGVRVHKSLEMYVKDGVYPVSTTERHGDPLEGDSMYVPDVGEIAARAIPFVPMEREIQAEVRIEELPSQPETRIPVVGQIDILCLDGPVPLVLDYKTTKTGDYMQTAANILNDIQMMIYAHFALLNSPDADDCEVCWLYLGTQRNLVHPVKKLVSREHVQDFWDSVVLPAIDEIEMAFFAGHEEMKRNYDFCSAYGGCRHAAVCEERGIPVHF